MKKTIDEMLSDAADRCGCSAELYSHFFTRSVLDLAKTLERDEAERLLAEARKTGEFISDPAPPPGCLLCGGNTFGGHGGYCPDCL